MGLTKIKVIKACHVYSLSRLHTRVVAINSTAFFTGIKLPFSFYTVQFDSTLLLEMYKSLLDELLNGDGGNGEKDLF